MPLFNYMCKFDWLSPLQYKLTWLFFCVVVHSALKSVYNSMVMEREKLKQLVSEHDVCNSPSAQIIGLKTALSSVSLETDV